MRIAHLSDFHISSVLKRSNIKKVRFLLNHALEKGFDHLVITGDIVNNADAKSFEIARRMLKNLGLLNSEKVSVVIGNHDIFGGVEEAEDILSFPGRCRNTDYDKKVTEFASYFYELFENCFFPDKESFFPFAKVVNDFVLIGLNSIDKYSKIKNPFASNGKLSEKQLSAAEKIFDRPEYRKKQKIVMIHHHFNKDHSLASSGSAHYLWSRLERQTMKLRDKKKIIKLFEKHKIQLVLHGHLHESSEYSRKKINFMNAGGSVRGSNPENVQINWIDIKRDMIRSWIETLSEGIIQPVSIKQNPLLEPRLVSEPI